MFEQGIYTLRQHTLQATVNRLWKHPEHSFFILSPALIYCQHTFPEARNKYISMKDRQLNYIFILISSDSKFFLPIWLQLNFTLVNLILCICSFCSDITKTREICSVSITAAHKPSVMIHAVPLPATRCPQTFSSICYYLTFSTPALICT